jgi:hypothetical protein
MTSRWLVLSLVLPLAGCTVPFRTVFEPVPLVAPAVEAPDPVYTKPEVDAIQAEVQCKALARTPVQMARCMGNRR